MGIGEIYIELLAGYWWVLPVAIGCVGLGFAAAKSGGGAKPAKTGKTKPAVRLSPVLIGNISHIGARESQQDSFGISDVTNAALCRYKGVFGVVADGMGGMADGAEVSAIVARTMLQTFNEAQSYGQPELDLLQMLFAANGNVNSFLSGRARGGSTVAAVILHDGELFWAAVGDSRIVLIRNGALIQVNREHTYEVELDERAAMGEITREEAANDPRRGALTSYLGMGELAKIDRNIRPVRLIEGDRVLLMSDGVFGVLSDDEILDAMPLEPQESAVNLREKVLAKQHPNQDNFTAIIFEYRSVSK